MLVLPRFIIKIHLI